MGALEGTWGAHISNLPFTVTFTPCFLPAFLEKAKFEKVKEKLLRE